MSFFDVEGIKEFERKVAMNDAKSIPQVYLRMMTEKAEQITFLVLL